VGKWLGWDVLGWCLAFFVPLGVAVLSMNEPTMAKVCFSIAALTVLTKTIIWGLATNHSIWIIALFVFISFGFIGILLVGSFRWVDRKELPQLLDKKTNKDISQKNPDASVIPSTNQNKKPQTEAIRAPEKILTPEPPKTPKHAITKFRTPDTLP
jgi:hypothetical protein